AITECGTIITESYCYGNSVIAQFPYTSGDPSVPLKVDFVAGQLEVAADIIKVYDGANTSAPLLYTGNNGGDLSGLNFTTTGSDLLIVVESDATVSCASQAACCNTPLQWEIGRVEDGGSGLTSNCECDPNNPNHQHLVVNGIHEGNPKIAPRTYHANVTVESNGHVQAPDMVAFKAGTSITLKAGFQVAAGSTFSAEIAECGNASSTIFKALPMSILQKKADISDTSIKVYPNPFQESLNINLQLKTATKVNLVVYDQLGKQVAVIAEGVDLASGQHAFTFSGKDLVGGIYFLTMNTATERVVKKFIKL
ncbi:MAG: T9SS type A sorting domain-containing protein, partial [Bacteroidota bacterium]